MTTTIIKETIRGRNLVEFIKKKIDHPDMLFEIVIKPVEKKALETSENKWKKAVKRIRSENYLKGKSDDVNKLFRQFRNDFSF